MPINDSLQTKLSNLLSKAVADNICPALIAVVFDKDGEIARTASGVTDVTTGDKVTPTSTIWFASMSKAVSSVAALVLVDREGFDIDSHEELVKVLPELKLGNGELISMIMGDEKNEDGSYKQTEAKKGVTLRHLLSHTSGLAYEFSDEKLSQIYEPKGTVPSIMSGTFRSINVPRCFEAGEGWSYGLSTDWLGVFIERVSKKLLPQAYKELVFEPLSIDPNTDLSAFVTPEMAQNRAIVHTKLGADQGAVWIPLPAVDASTNFAENPPDGHLTLAGGPLRGNVPGYPKFARSFLNKTAPFPGGTPLISEKLWEHASGDSLARFGISLPEYAFRSLNQAFSKDFLSDGMGEGWTLLQTAYNRVETESGRRPGAMAWAGIANSYFFVDPLSGVGGVIATQMIPFQDEGVLKVKDDFEKLIYAELKK